MNKQLVTQVVIGVLTTVIAAGIIYIGSQLNTIGELQNDIKMLQKIIIELPTTTESKKLDRALGDLESIIGNNEAALGFILMKLRQEGIISEQAFYNFYNNDDDK